MDNLDTAYFLPDALVLGVPEIDSEHAQIFEHLVALKAQHIETNSFPAASADQLVAALRSHFATEERLARTAGLDFAAHADKHQRMLGLVELNLGKVRDGGTDIFSLYRYLGYWFERHIEEEDKAFRTEEQTAHRARSQLDG